MTSNLTKYFYLLLLMQLPTYLYSQSSEYIVRQFTTENGLPHNVCYEVMEDKYGNIWIGTDNGLAKYTPQGLEVFGEEDGLSGPYLTALKRYKGDTVLISNWGNGLDYFYKGSIGEYANELSGGGKFNSVQVGGNNILLTSSDAISVFRQGRNLTLDFHKVYHDYTLFVGDHLNEYTENFLTSYKTFMTQDGKVFLFKDGFVGRYEVNANGIGYFKSDTSFFFPRC